MCHLANIQASEIEKIRSATICGWQTGLQHVNLPPWHDDRSTICLCRIIFAGLNKYTSISRFKVCANAPSLPNWTLYCITIQQFQLMLFNLNTFNISHFKNVLNNLTCIRNSQTLTSSFSLSLCWSSVSVLTVARCVRPRNPSLLRARRGDLSRPALLSPTSSYNKVG